MTPANPGTDTGTDPGTAVGGVARRAMVWSVLNTLVSRVGTTLVGILLARILVPEDYGVYAVALVALNALLSMNELGVSLAIVRWPGDVSRIAPTVVTLAVTSSVVLWIGALLAAPWVASAMGAPEATNVLRVLTVAVLIDAVTAVPAGLMTRQFLQRERLVVDLAGFVVASGLGVGLALAGFGAWSLAWSALVGNVVNGVLILRMAPANPRPGFDRAVARELLAFGLPLAVASLLVFALLNVDYIVVGAELGAVSLGLYLLAFNLSTWPVNMISAPVRRVSVPAFARLDADGGGVPAQGRSSASAAFATAGTALLAATLPACLLIAMFAGPIVEVVYGQKWRPAADVLPWLMVLALVRVVGELAYDFLVALGRSRQNLVVQAAWFAALVPALLVGVRVDGIRGLAIAHAAVSAFVVIPAYAVVVARAGVSLMDLGRGLVRPAIGLAFSAAAGLTVLAALESPLLGLLLGGAAASAAYVAVVHPMRHLYLSRPVAA